ncbi:hypothetical protein SLEP1_g22892 [Rubroshorea leprosula]|uniref:Uncharacterized protein n=1 Tax=Rubroshorea leprosula TaxID=152421 RepID=A0AAV5JDL7_9ROSI|nr:hypothetical protein SLEP1_g22892 [Rubroshorea leprosula]
MNLIEIIFTKRRRSGIARLKPSLLLPRTLDPPVLRCVR